MENPKQIDISLASFIRAALVVIMIIGIYTISNIIIVFFLSLIIGSAASIWARELARYRIPKVIAILGIYLIAFLIMGLFMWLVIPPLADEVNDLARSLPEYYQSVADVVSRYISGVQELSPNFQSAVSSIARSLRDASTNAVSFLASIFGGVVSFVVVIVISFYLAFQEKSIEKILRILTPQEYESYIINLWNRSQIKLGRWLQGQIVLGIIIGAIVFIGLTLLGVPFALILGMIAGILEIVPIVGPVISATFAVIIALLVSPTLALLTLIFFIIVQQIENHIIAPLLMQKMTGLNPVVIILSLMVGFELGGVLGMIIAVPLVAVFGEFVKDLAGKKDIDL